jgi:hypothetical protein
VYSPPPYHAGLATRPRRSHYIAGAVASGPRLLHIRQILRNRTRAPKGTPKKRGSVLIGEGGAEDAPQGTVSFVGWPRQRGSTAGTAGQYLATRAGVGDAAILQRRQRPHRFVIEITSVTLPLRERRTSVVS